MPRTLPFQPRAVLLAVVLTAACGELPDAPTSALDAGHTALPAERCDNVRGRVAGNVFTGSLATGDLEGIVAAYSAPIALPSGQALHLQTFHRFILVDGTFDTVDRGIQAPIAPPVYRLNNDYRIVGGTGAWANAAGFLHVHGTLVIDFTFQDPRNGDIDVSYQGRVCR